MARPPDAFFSKSQFVRGLQCERSLWLYRNRKDLIPAVDPAKQMIFDQGHEVGVLAHARFPGGTLIEEDHTAQEAALSSTKKAVAKGAKALYEAAALFDHVLVRADILVKNGAAWDLVEVKSSTAVKDVYLCDVAIQRHVLEGAGFKIERACLMHVDNRYVRRGALDPNEFFALDDVTEATEELLAQVPAYLKALKRAVAADSEPSKDIGPHCFAPYDCDFEDHCWSHVPEYSVFDLAMARMDKKTALWRKGIKTVDQIPDSIKLTAGQARQVRAARTGETKVDRDAVAAHLAALKYPLYFLDFETVSPAVPPFDGLRPFQKLPFQASVHVVKAPGGKVEHLDYLAPEDEDPRGGVAAFLVNAIGPKGSVVAYNKSFEGGVLAELAQTFPLKARELSSICKRLWDLMIPFQKGDVVHPGFRGSWSIKKVLPALVPGSGYDGLLIADGDQAQTAYLALMKGKIKGAEARRLREALEEYCAQDTLAMVELLERLHRFLGGV